MAHFIKKHVIFSSLLITTKSIFMPTLAWCNNVSQQPNQQIFLEQLCNSTLQKQQEQKSRNHAAVSEPVLPQNEVPTQLPLTDSPCFIIHQIYIQELTHRFAWTLSDAQNYVTMRVLASAQNLRAGVLA